MEHSNLSKLRALALSFLLPGLAGLILSATISMLYMNTLPRYPDPLSRRMVPRDINGYTVYQTEEEDSRLDRVEYTSVGIFLVGLAAGMVYLQKWGIKRAIEAEDDEYIGEEG